MTPCYQSIKLDNGLRNGVAPVLIVRSDGPSIKLIFHEGAWFKSFKIRRAASSARLFSFINSHKLGLLYDWPVFSCHKHKQLIKLLVALPLWESWYRMSLSFVKGKCTVCLICWKQFPPSKNNPRVTGTFTHTNIILSVSMNFTAPTVDITIPCWVLNVQEKEKTNIKSI